MHSDAKSVRVYRCIARQRSLVNATVSIQKGFTMLSGKYDKSINSLSSIAKICIQTSVLLGVLVTITYCGIINHYPSGLTIGDSLFFIAASLAFAITYSIAVLAMFCAGVTISPFLRWIQPLIFIFLDLILKIKNKPKFLGRVNFPHLKIDSFAQVLVGLLLIVITVNEYSKDFDKAFAFTLTILLMGLIWGVWNTKPRRREYDVKSERKLKFGLAIMTFLMPLLLIQSEGSFLNHSMGMIGVRAESSIIQLEKKYTDFLKVHSINPVKTTKDGEGIYEEVIILFRGIGTNVVIEIDGFNLSVPAKNIVIGK